MRSGYRRTPHKKAGIMNKRLIQLFGGSESSHLRRVDNATPRCRLVSSSLQSVSLFIWADFSPSMSMTCWSSLELRDGSNGAQAVQLLLGVGSPDAPHGLDIDADLQRHGGEGALGAVGLDVFDQALRHVVLQVHVRHLLVVGPLAADALEPLLLDDDAHLLPVHRGVEEHASASAVFADVRGGAATGRRIAGNGDLDFVLAGHFDNAAFGEVLEVKHGREDE